MRRVKDGVMDAARRLMKLGVIPYGALFRDRRRGLIILIYHRVGGGTNSSIDMPVDVFERQMAHLRERYTLVSLDTAVADGTLHRAGGPDLVAVTFDDGHRETYDQAFPIMLRYRVPATVYLATRYVESQQPFEFGHYAAQGGRPLPVTWEQAREMVASGLVGIGAHTHSHVDLTRLPTATVRDEVERSRRLIEDRVGVPARHFAYPWGKMTPAVRATVAESFATAVRGGCRKNPFGGLDPMGLWRTPIQQSDGFWFFRLKLGSYLDGEEFFRKHMPGSQTA